MGSNDIELLDDDDEMKSDSDQKLNSIPNSVINNDENQISDSSPAMIDPETVSKSVISSRTTTEDKQTASSVNTQTTSPKMISPEDVLQQVGVVVPKMISPEDVVQQVGSTPSQIPQKNISNVQKIVQQIQSEEVNEETSKDTPNQNNIVKSSGPAKVYIPHTIDIDYKVPEEKQKPNYNLLFLLVPAVVLFSLGIILSIVNDNSKIEKPTQDDNQTTGTIIENEKGNSYFYVPVSNKVQKGTSNETTYYILGEENSGQKELYDGLINKYSINNVENNIGQYENSAEIGPIKEKNNLWIILPTQYDGLNERIIKSTNKDGSIIVIKSSVGVTKKTEEHLRLMNQLGAKKTIVYIYNDDTTNNIDKLEKEIKKLLKKCGYDENNTPIIEGNVKDSSSIDDLYESINDWIDIVADRNEEQPKVHINNIADYKTNIQINISIEKGTIKVGDKIDLLGKDYIQTETVDKIIVNQEEVESVNSSVESDRIYIVINKKYEKNMSKATMISTAGTISMHNKFDAIFFFEKSNKDNGKLSNNSSQTIQLHSVSTGKIKLPNEVNYLIAGDTSNMTINLDDNIPLYKGQQFTINDQSTGVFGYGQITKIYK